MHTDFLSEQRESSPYAIWPMRREHIPQVMQIETEAFPEQWPAPTYRSELKNSLAHYFVLLESCQSPAGIAGGSSSSPDGGTLAPLAGQGFRAKVVRALAFIGLRPPVGGGACLQAAGRVVGAAGFWLMVDEAHITTIAVRGSHRRLGLGELLLAYIIDRASELNARVVTLEVRVSNTVAQKLYDKYGFLKAGVRKGYYTDNGEDALVMTTDRITSAGFQSRFQSLKKELSKRLGQEVHLLRPSL